MSSASSSNLLQKRAYGDAQHDGEDQKQKRIRLSEDPIVPISSICWRKQPEPDIYRHCGLPTLKESMFRISRNLASNNPPPYSVMNTAPRDPYLTLLEELYQLLNARPLCLIVMEYACLRSVEETWQAVYGCNVLQLSINIFCKIPWPQPTAPLEIEQTSTVAMCAHSFLQTFRTRGAVDFQTARLAVHHLLLRNGPIEWILFAVRLMEYYAQKCPASIAVMDMTVLSPRVLEQMVSRGLFDACAKVLKIPAKLAKRAEVSEDSLLFLVGRMHTPEFQHAFVLWNLDALLKSALERNQPRLAKAVGEYLDPSQFQYAVTGWQIRDRIIYGQAVASLLRGSWKSVSDDLFWECFIQAASSMDLDELKATLATRDARFWSDRRQEPQTFFLSLMCYLIKAGKRDSAVYICKSFKVDTVEFAQSLCDDNCMGVGDNLGALCLDNSVATLEALFDMLPHINCSIAASAFRVTPYHMDRHVTPYHMDRHPDLRAFLLRRFQLLPDDMDYIDV